MSCFEKVKSVVRTLFAPYRRFQAWYENKIDENSSSKGIEEETDMEIIKDKITFITPIIQDAYNTCFIVFKLFVTIVVPLQVGMFLAIKNLDNIYRAPACFIFAFSIVFNLLIILDFAKNPISLSYFCKKYIIYKIDISDVIKKVYFEKIKLIHGMFILFLFIIPSVTTEIFMFAI